MWKRIRIRRAVSKLHPEWSHAVSAIEISSGKENLWKIYIGDLRLRTNSSNLLAVNHHLDASFFNSLEVSGFYSVCVPRSLGCFTASSSVPSSSFSSVPDDHLDFEPSSTPSSTRRLQGLPSASRCSRPLASLLIFIDVFLAIPTRQSG